ncbi:MAG: DUF5104 domain-containing protein [Oscillospiraceae bacterium]|nr:DUF5104 domain-containing protein [Oscillospiraceae bacterium]
MEFLCKIWAGIVAFFVMIGAWFGIFNVDATLNKIAKCLETHDTATIVSMMSPKMSTIDDLTGKVDELLGLIDGNIKQMTTQSTGSYQDGSVRGRELRFTMDIDTMLHLVIRYDTSDPRGIVRMTLSTGRFGENYVQLYEIKAP